MLKTCFGRRNRRNMVRYVFELGTEPHIQTPFEGFCNSFLASNEQHNPDSKEERQWGSATVISDNTVPSHIEDGLRPKWVPDSPFFVTDVGRNGYGQKVSGLLKSEQFSKSTREQEKDLQLRVWNRYIDQNSVNGRTDLLVSETPVGLDSKDEVELLRCNEDWATVSKELQVFENLLATNTHQPIGRPKVGCPLAMRARASSISNSDHLVKQKGSDRPETLCQKVSRLPVQLRQSSIGGSSSHFRSRHRGPWRPGIYCNGLLLGSKPSMQRTGSKPSRFCHICLRRAERVALLACSRIRKGGCRKVICERCFVEFGWGWDGAAQPGSEWTCTHCRQV